MRRAFALAVLALAALVATAQEGGLAARMGNRLERHYYGVGVDTLYVARPATRWTLKGRFALHTTELTTSGTHNGTPISTSLNPDMGCKVSLSASYLGLTASASVNPRRLLGSGNDYELSLNYYGRRMGAELSAGMTSSPTGWIRRGEGDTEPFPLDDLSQGVAAVNLYYVFNARRFSYPAAFSQSYIQRRGSGSLLAGASASYLGLQLGSSREGMPRYEFSSLQVGLGLGYGYNFVPGRRWLLHISALPTVVLTGQRRYLVDGEGQPLGRSRAEFAIVGRGAVVYSIDRLFASFTHIFNFSNTEAGEVGLRSLRSQMLLSVGVRL